ncbi:hypothetical protein V6N13_091796 [Hibiscus sabdariffa]
MRSDDSKLEKNQNQEGRLNSASNIMNKQHRQIEGVIDNDKMEILNVCAIGFFADPTRWWNCCELVEESELSGKQDGKKDEKARIAVSAVKGGDCENSSEETVVPNSISLTAMNTLEVDKMWEDNKVVDWRVMETASWMIDENIGMVQRDEEVRDSDVSAECGLRDELPV